MGAATGRWSRKCSETTLCTFTEMSYAIRLVELSSMAQITYLHGVQHLCVNFAELEDAWRALEDLGLTPYEARVYVALADGSARTASEIVRLTGIPQPRVYSTLESLASRGLVEIILEKPRRYRAVDPRVAVDILYSSTVLKLQRSKDAVVRALEERYRRVEGGGEGVKLLRNRREIVNRARRIIEGAQLDVLLAGDPRFLEQLAPSLARLSGLKPRRAIAVVSYGEPPSAILKIPSASVCVREVPVMPVLVVDSSVGLLVSETSALEITGTGLMRVLNDFFYHALWRVSEERKTFTLTAGEELMTTCIWLIRELEKLRCPNLQVVVEGVDRRSGAPTRVSGGVSAFLENGKGVVMSLLIQSSSGGAVRVGWIGTLSEDIEGKVFRLRCEA
ncbi:MAG: TrmB family transcriptional regulator sugar-binding domain-containing protein [Thermofilum sp.]